MSRWGCGPDVKIAGKGGSGKPKRRRGGRDSKRARERRERDEDERLLQHARIGQTHGIWKMIPDTRPPEWVWVEGVEALEAI